MADQAHIDATHIIPETGLVYRVVAAVHYGSNEADISMPLEPPLAQEKMGEFDWTSRLRELGEALLRIADAPAAITPRPRRST